MKIKELDDYLGVQDVVDYDLFEEQEQEQRLWLEQRAIHIPDYNIKIREGFCEVWDTESEQYEVDHTFYMIFDRLMDEMLYTESGSGMSTSLHNFIVLNSQQHLTQDAILDLSCEVEFIL